MMDLNELISQAAWRGIANVLCLIGAAVAVAVIIGLGCW